MRFQGLLAIVISSFVVLPSAAFAARSRAVIKPAPEMWEGTDAKGKPVTCAVHRNKNIVVKVKGRKVLNVAAKLKELKKALKNEDPASAKAKKLSKQIKSFQKYNKSAKAVCRLGPPPPPPVETPPPSDPTPTPIPEQFSMEPVTGAVSASAARYTLRKIGFGYTESENERTFVSLATSQGIGAALNHYLAIKPQNQALFDRVRDRFDTTLGNLSTQLRSSETDEGYREALLDWDVNTDDAFTHNLRHFMQGLWTIGTTSFVSNAANNPQRVLGKEYVFSFLDSVARNPHLPSHHHAMTTHPAMLLWLDNSQNKATIDPFSGQLRVFVNENFARENMELFSLGTHRTVNCETGERVENYTEEFQGNRTLGDIFQAALGLTGMEVQQVNNGGTLYWRYLFSPADHYPHPVTLFRGTSYEKVVTEPEQIVRALYDHPGAPEFIARQLAEYFLTTNPPCQLVQSLAQVVRAKDFNLREVMKVFAASKAFHHPQYAGTLIMDPWRLSVSFIRQVGLNRGTAGSPTAEAGVNIRSREGEIVGAGNMEFNPLNPTDGVFWFPKDFATSINMQMKSTNFFYNVMVDTNQHAALSWDVIERFVPENPLELPSAIDVVNYAADLMGVALNDSQRMQLAFYLDNSSPTTPSRFDPRIGSHATRVRMLLVLLAIQPNYRIP